MKRAIKYHSIYASDGANFSTCSTRYEVLPGLYDDNAGIAELRQVAKKHKLKTRGVAELKDQSQEVKVTEALTLVGKIDNRGKFGNNRNDFLTQYIGFVKLINIPALPAMKTINNKTPDGLLHDLINEGDNDRLGISDYGTSKDDELWLILADWGYFHHMAMLGYSREKFRKIEGIAEEYFSDSVFQCGACASWDHTDSGYTYNYRIHNGEMLGIHCGCFANAVEADVESWANDGTKAIESDITETLVKQGRLKFISRYVGGMTDSGRSHSYGGESVDVGDPASILEDLLDKSPNSKFVFSIDGAGQFQTYFSVYKILKQKGKKAA